MVPVIRVCVFRLHGRFGRSNHGKVKCGHRDVFSDVLLTSPRSPVLHGEVGDVGVGRDLELEDALGGGGVPVEHGAVHRGEGVAGDDGGLDGELLDVRFGLLREEKQY